MKTGRPVTRVPINTKPLMEALDEFGETMTDLAFDLGYHRETISRAFRKAEADRNLVHAMCEWLGVPESEVYDTETNNS